MSEVRVRSAREADVRAIERFVPGAIDWPTVISAAGAVVATDGDAVAGVLIRWPHPAHVLIELLAVAPHSRRRGVGTVLLDRAELEAIEAGVNLVRARAGGGADPFLRRSGYTRTPDGDGLEKHLDGRMP